MDHRYRAPHPALAAVVLLTLAARVLNPRGCQVWLVLDIVACLSDPRTLLVPDYPLALAAAMAADLMVLERADGHRTLDCDGDGWLQDGDLLAGVGLGDFPADLLDALGDLGFGTQDFTRQLHRDVFSRTRTRLVASVILKRSSIS